MRWLGRATASLSLLVLVSSATPARADHDIRIETKGGWTEARLTGDLTESNWRNGFTGGLAFEWRLNPTVSLQSEILYASMGNVYDDFQDATIGPDTYHWELTLDYLEVPALVRMGRSFGALRPAVMVGPVVGFKVRERFALKGPGIDIAGNNLAGRITDMSAAGGLGLEIGPEDGCLSLEARYQRSLLDVQKSSYPGSFRNSSLRLTAGWKMRWPSVFRPD